MPNNYIFEWIAPSYDKIIGARDPETLIKDIGLPIEGSLLDLGGGTGRISENITHHVGKLILTDISIPMLQQAQSKNLELISQASSQRLPFKDNSFDRVIVVDALHHFEDQAQVVSEIYRVLKRGGIAMIEEPNIQKFAVKMIAIFETITLMKSKIHHPDQIARFMGNHFSNIWVDLEDKFAAKVFGKK